MANAERPPGGAVPAGVQVTFYQSNTAQSALGRTVSDLQTAVVAIAAQLDDANAHRQKE